MAIIQLLIPVTQRAPFLITVPHGGTEVPDGVRERLLLSADDLRYYCDPLTRDIFGYRDRAAAYIDTAVSRMVVDLNRPPLPLPLRDPDGTIKVRTIDGREVWRPGLVPDITLAHQLLVAHYFPFHQKVDELIDRHPIRIAFDCHSMLPYGSEKQKDAGKSRPLICLGNNGDRRGRARKGSIATCSGEWITTLAGVFREEFALGEEVALNNPFSGGFIANAHFWHKGIPWVQIEINRSLYETPPSPDTGNESGHDRAAALREKIWNVLKAFWDQVGDKKPAD
jgi:formiminoglutamase